MPSLHDYAGCIHFHSAFSYDAYQPIQEIVAAGLRAGLDYAILTDHFTLEARDEGWEKSHQDGGRTLRLIVGEEISPRYNHYLALQIQKPVVVSKTALDPQQMIDDVNAQGGFGFIAHPGHTGSLYVGVRAYPWVAWDVKGYAGLSIWDLLGDWTAALRSPWGVFRAAISPARVLRGPIPGVLQRWDALNAVGRCPAIGEIDNHGNVRSFLGFSKRVFSFDFAFRTIRTHVLLEGPLKGDATDQPAILEALRTGRSYVSLDYWNDPKGFSFRMFDDKNEASIGGEFTRRGPALIEVKLPSSGRIRLIRDGQCIWRENSRAHFQRDLELAGVYRVEVDQRIGGCWRPWIFSNPIWVK